VSSLDTIRKEKEEEEEYLKDEITLYEVLNDALRCFFQNFKK